MTATTNGRSQRAEKLPGTWNPPQRLEAEKSLIGCVLLGGHEIFDAVAPTISDGDFYLVRHAAIWRTMIKLREQDEPLDSVLIADNAGEAQGSGIYDLLVAAEEAVPHPGRAAYYAGLVVEASRRRQAIFVGTDLSLAVRDESVDLEDVIASAEGKLHKILERTSGEAVPVSEVVHEIYSRIGTEKKPGLHTGFCDLDQMLGGLYPGQLVILAARPGVGKTALAGNVTLNVADAGTGVLFFSLEQSQVELTERFYCSLARIDTDTLGSRNISEATMDSITKAANRLKPLPILIDDTAPRTVSQIAALSRVHRRRHKVGLVVVDYLQLVSPEDKRVPREQQVAEVARGLKLLARSLEIPVLAPAQLNRNVEARSEQRPMLSDLRESGAIEQDADIVMFLDRPGARSTEADQAESTLIVAKHRNGRTGDVSLNWEARSMTFRNAANIEEFRF